MGFTVSPARTGSLGVLSIRGTEYGPDETARSRAAELTYWFAPDYHGQGYGSDAAGRLFGTLSRIGISGG